MHVEPAWRVVNIAREKWAAFGAMDSEPRRVVEAYFDIWFPQASGCNFRIDREDFQLPFV
jgi:hypothetical protein